MRNAVLALSLVACGASTPDTATPIATSTTATTPTTDEVGAHVAALEGNWVGTADPTPMGPMPFALHFAWEDGSLHARTDNGAGFALDFRFALEDGSWVMHEEGTLPGGFTQTRVLDPVAIDGRTVAWEDRLDPDYLYVETRALDDRMVLDATVKRARHATLDLDRQ